MAYSWVHCDCHYKLMVTILLTPFPWRLKNAEKRVDHLRVDLLFLGL